MDMIINDYHIVQKLYESPQSLIYRGFRGQDQQTVILKILQETYPDPITLSQFKQEYKILNHLASSAVIKTYGMENYQTTLMIILEDIGGISLEKFLEEQKLTIETFLKIRIV